LAAKDLSQNDVAFGRAFLLATDALGMSAEGAFWLYDPRDKEWRYFLISSLFESMGSRGLYSRLQQALAKTLSEKESVAFPFYIASPSEKLVKDIRRYAKTSRYATEPLAIEGKIGGEKTSARVYRLSVSLADAQMRTVQRRFKRRTNDLLVA
jgi:hypothetical protein